MDEGSVLTTLKILIIGESGVGKSRWVGYSLSLLSTTDCTAKSQVYEILLDHIAGLFQVIIIILGPTLLLHLMCVCVCVFV